LRDDSRNKAAGPAEDAPAQRKQSHCTQNIEDETYCEEVRLRVQQNVIHRSPPSVERRANQPSHAGNHSRQQLHGRAGMVDMSGRSEAQDIQAVQKIGIE
jgi:hypothetical protein